MDKQQAIQHILTRLRAGYNQEEITEELSRILKAPPETIRRFVNQVIADNPEVAPLPLEPETTPPPEWVQTLTTQSEPHQVNSGNPSTHTDLPPGLQVLIDGDDSPSVNEQYPENFPNPQNNPDLAISQQPALYPAAEEREETRNSGESDNIDLDALSKSVLNQLKKQRRQNDVIESVCQQTGWHWNKAQRFVARVKTQNHGQLQSRQNAITIAFGIGIIIVGLIMTLNGASVLSDYAKLAAFARTNPEVLLNVSPQSVIFAIASTFTGIGMIIGGGYGIGRALTNR